jgi:isopenicillin-N N-acyltransferase like protein
LKDFGFPYIEYDPQKSPKQWGQKHGEEYREGITQLFNIRKELMLAKSPHLGPYLEPLAKEQWKVTSQFAPHIAEELEGIAEGAALTLTDIIILNNYTDFRDIELPEEGCSTVAFRDHQNMVLGQTWDMHGSAKDYLCLIKVPEKDGRPEILTLSLLGCTALMGINQHGLFVGVNNINTDNARAALVWPVLVRKVLENQTLKELEKELISAPVTSGHNYIIGDGENASHWEITPTQKENIGILDDLPHSYSFHTNHCLGEKVKKEETKNSLSSTTFARFSLLEEKLPHLEHCSDLKELLTNHDGHPKSICSHYQAAGIDPSTTCGGGILNYQDHTVNLWRGCPVHDKNFKEYTFKLDKEGHEKFKLLEK